MTICEHGPVQCIVLHTVVSPDSMAFYPCWADDFVESDGCAVCDAPWSPADGSQARCPECGASWVTNSTAALRNWDRVVSHLLEREQEEAWASVMSSTPGHPPPAAPDASPPSRSPWA